MKKNLPLLFILFTLVIALYAPRSPAQIQPAALQDFQPPQLLTPENGSTIKGAPEFFWTSAVLPKGFRGSYKLKVVPVSPRQSPGAAMTGNPPVHQATMRRTGEAYPADGPALKNGQTYAWGVQVVDANGAPVGGDQGMSEVYIFTFETASEGTETASSASIEINMGPLVMTGIRNDAPAEPPRVIEIDMDPLVMTGIRNDAPVEPPRVIEIEMGPLVMTGIRNDAPAEPPRVIEIDMGPLVMTGIRTEQPKPPVEGDKTKIKPKVQEELKKKLDLPFKKPETVEGANPPAEPIGGAQMKQSGTGKAVGDTVPNKILGKMPSMTTPEVPEKPDGGTGKSSLQQKIETKKTVDDASVEKKKPPVLQPAGTK